MSSEFESIKQDLLLSAINSLHIEYRSIIFQT